MPHSDFLSAEASGAAPDAGSDAARLPDFTVVLSCSYQIL